MKRIEMMVAECDACPFRQWVKDPWDKGQALECTWTKGGVDRVGVRPVGALYHSEPFPDWCPLPDEAEPKENET